MDNSTIKSEIIYGDLYGTPQKGCFVKVSTWSDCNHISIDLANNGHHAVWNFEMKDKKYINKIKDEIEDICDDIDETAGFGACMDLLEDNIDEIFINMYDEWFEEEPEYEPKMRAEEEIGEYMSEACDRVWLVRKQNLVCGLLEGTESINLDILEGMTKAIKEVCDKYKIDFSEPVSDWDYGYWSGILAALRWVMGEEKDMLDT